MRIGLMKTEKMFAGLINLLFFVFCLKVIEICVHLMVSVFCLKISSASLSVCDI